MALVTAAAVNRLLAEKGMKWLTKYPMVETLWSLEEVEELIGLFGEFKGVMTIPKDRLWKFQRPHLMCRVVLRKALVIYANSGFWDELTYSRVWAEETRLQDFRS
jgi:hypothetical protein